MSEIITEKGINLDEIYVDEILRLDQILSKKLNISRNQVANLIKDANVKINDKTILKSSFTPKFNDKITINLPQISPLKQTQKVDFDVEIIYEDEDILVINKQSNLVVHPAPSVKEATLVEWLKDKNYMLSTINGEFRAGIVHRLDKGTSGAMVVAKNNKAHAALSKQLSDKSMGRIYLACLDLPLKQNLLIDKPIGRNPNNRLKKAVISDGRVAKSAFLNIYSDAGLNLVAAKLFTGRTHQIRVHLASINRHILGDTLYGFKSENDKIPRVMLHAYLLYFTHPTTGKRVEFVANLWSDFLNLIDKDKNKEQIYEQILPDTISGGFRDCDGWMCLNIT
ncbi:ribosomal pseudouridine synthase [Campylobacter geochelonis]|uniref:Pseudouridine synthase n=1 Tax=Campylobacter geochelonis TaxID=1780362 RepID=A0A128EJU7_9BACT|nr:ribosomal pseudouridine synthase [Campylobacter geochelonis]